MRRLSLLFVGGVFLLMAVLLAAASPAAAERGGNGNNAAGPKRAAKDKAGGQGNQTAVAGRLVRTTVGADTVHLLQDGGGRTLYYLQLGPPWFAASSANPLNNLVGQQVSIIGKAKQGALRAVKGANGGVLPANAPVLDVVSINGRRVHGGGPPPWAGGPKKVPGHPGGNNRP